MPSDTPQGDEHRDPRDGTAAVVPVTAEMMDHAAHAAAAMADAVARGERRIEAAAADAAEAAVDQAAEAARDGTAAVETAATTVSDIASDASDAATRSAEAAARAAEDATDAARNGLSASADAFAQYNAKVVEVARANMASTTALFAALVQAKSVPEALAINADHMRRQLEAMTTQGRELATLAQAVAFDALRPFKGRPGR